MIEEQFVIIFKSPGGSRAWYVQEQNYGYSLILTMDHDEAAKYACFRDAKAVWKRFVAGRPDIANPDRWSIIGTRTEVTQTEYSVEMQQL